jgi:hypothetical protein
VEITSRVYKPRDPGTTVLYEVVRDNLETLYGAIGDGAIAVRSRGCCRQRAGCASGC